MKEEENAEEIINELIRQAGGWQVVETCLFRRSKSARENEKMILML